MLRRALSLGDPTPTDPLTPLSCGRGQYVGDFSIAGVNHLDRITLPGFIGAYIHPPDFAVDDDVADVPPPAL
ncbi:MAG: hypothetical protein ABI862_00670 [Ilumatobacteraceae bacterium]